MPDKSYSLPELTYGYKDLEPHISQEQLTIHHQKHHAAYVKGANEAFEKLEEARKNDLDLDMKSVLKSLSFHIGGHILHSLFWQNLAPAGKGGGGEPQGELADALNEEFGSFERMKREFTQAAASIEGSGWAALTLDRKTGRPVIMQIEKHNLNMYPNFKLLMVLDFWEHAYYIDYKNEKGMFADAFWSIINWKEAAKRFSAI